MIGAKLGSKDVPLEAFGGDRGRARRWLSEHEATIRAEMVNGGRRKVLELLAADDAGAKGQDTDAPAKGGILVEYMAQAFNPNGYGVEIEPEGETRWRVRLDELRDADVANGGVEIDAETAITAAEAPEWVEARFGSPCFVQTLQGPTLAEAAAFWLVGKTRVSAAVLAMALNEEADIGDDEAERLEGELHAHLENL